MKLRILLPVLIFSLFSRIGSAQKSSPPSSFDADLLDAYFDSLAHHDRAMGSLAIHRGGELVYARAIGFADADRQRPATLESVYQVGSITKTFTSVIVHALAAAGKLDLDDPLAKYYPSLPNAEDITLEMMLRHRSGLANYTSAIDFPMWASTPQSPEWLVQRIAAMDSAFAPDEKSDYSNSNYLLLGYIAERASGRSYAELLKTYVTEPLGLDHTYAPTVNNGDQPASDETSVLEREVVSFEKSGDDWEAVPAWALGNAGGAGFLRSTATDLNVFYRALLRGELTTAEHLKGIKELRDGMGRGLFTYPFGKKNAYGHTGGIEGFATMSGYFPEEDLAITYLCNGEDVAVNDVMIAALSIYFGQAFDIPDFAPVPAPPLAELESYVGTYASPSFPLKVNVFVEAGALMARAMGQGAFPLTPAGEGAFVFPAAGIRLVFDAGAGTMRLLQGGNDVLMERE